MDRIAFILLAVLQLQASWAACADYSNSSPVELLQAYVQINTTTYHDLSEAVEFWRELAAVADVPINVYEIVEGFPIVVLKWAGADSSQRSIMLNSHMDVVPAALEDGWTYDPFSGHIDENNVMYGRGTQDMKSVSIQYYSALRRLKENNVTLLRDVYMTLMPDEEVGAEAGMIPFLQSEEFAAMNVGIELDEGSSFPMPIIAVFYQDKVVWQIKVDCHGISAHGSTFPATNDTATGKCRNVMNKFFEFRDEQYELAKVAPPNDAGGYTSVNINKINGGTANNVIPSLISLTIDIRLGTRVNEEQMDAKIRQMIAESGSNITFSYILKNPQSPATIVNASNPYWNAVTSAAEELGVQLLATIPPGSTDARHVRNAGFPALGLSPMPDTELLLHAVNERLAIDTFTKGIDLYEKIINNLANIPAEYTAEDGTEYLKVTAG